MRKIDWNLVNHDLRLKSEFSLNVFNRFSELSNSTDTIQDNYDTLVKATEEVAPSTLPKKVRVKHEHLSKHKQVKSAREAVNKAASKHHSTSSPGSLKELKRSHKLLDTAYVHAQIEHIQGKIDEIAMLHISKQHTAAWNTINELTGRKSKPNIKIKGSSQRDRIGIDKWQSHFKNLLGEPPQTPPDTVIPIIKISETLPISTSPFFIIYYQLVYSRLK